MISVSDVPELSAATQPLKPSESGYRSTSRYSRETSPGFACASILGTQPIAGSVSDLISRHWTSKATLPVRSTLPNPKTEAAILEA